MNMHSPEFYPQSPSRKAPAATLHDLRYPLYPLPVFDAAVVDLAKDPFVSAPSHSHPSQQFSISLKLVLPVRITSQQAALRASATDIEPSNVVGKFVVVIFVSVSVYADYDLKTVMATIALVRFRFRISQIVCTVAHQMFGLALRTGANRDACILIGLQFKEIAAALAFDVGETVDRITVFSTVASQFLTQIRVVIAIPILKFFPECHRVSAEERTGSVGRRIAPRITH